MAPRPATPAESKPDTARPRRGRPPLAASEVQSRIADYCRRYGVACGDSGLPPFPSGRRESRQHREWLGLYRAHQRAAQRAAALQGSPPPHMTGRTQEKLASCAICGRGLSPDDEEELPLAGRRRVRLHGACAELARQALRAGPDAVAALQQLLWPRRG